MLRSVKQLNNYVLDAIDGEIGRCKDFLFDDDFWTIRFMVADTGKWLPGTKVLISPIALKQPDWTGGLFPVRLTKEQLKNAPGIDEAKPVSRQYESAYFKYYGWPYYWADKYVWGTEAVPGALYDMQMSEDVKNKDVYNDKHLRSIREVTGYHINSLDDEFGHVEDFIIDDETWTIRYVVIDTKNWLPGSKKVLVSTDWISDIKWSDARINVALKQEEIKKGPEYDPSEPVNREYEIRLFDFYGKPVYWQD